MQAFGRADVGLLVGGISPPSDHQRLRDMGVRAFFGPGTTIAKIAAILQPIPEVSVDVDQLSVACRAGDKLCIARLITVAANGLAPDISSLGMMFRIEVTGSPGVGKSSLIADLIQYFGPDASTC
ncbi:MAG: hypothetical protein WKF77_07445 [Planctomycetaceae bacterium]